MYVLCRGVVHRKRWPPFRFALSRRAGVFSCGAHTIWRNILEFHRKIYASLQSDLKVTCHQVTRRPIAKPPQRPAIGMCSASHFIETTDNAESLLVTTDDTEPLLVTTSDAKSLLATTDDTEA